MKDAGSGPAMPGGRIRPGRQGKSFSGSLGPASRSPAGMRSLQEVTRLLATVRRPITRRDVWPDRFRAISALGAGVGWIPIKILARPDPGILRTCVAGAALPASRSVVGLEDWLGP